MGFEYVAIEQPQPGAFPDHTNAAPGQSVILVIHQDEAVAQMCEQLLGKHGFRVDWAIDGSDGIRKAYRMIPDVILAGAAVPELNGYQICRLMKHDPVMRKIPILLLADLARKMERFWGMKAGVDDFLQTDELEAKLLKKVQMVLEIYDRMQPDEKTLLQSEHEKNPFNIRARINQILDTSLVESMLMVEFRSLADLVHDPGLLNYMLFSLLESIVEYDVAGLLYNDEGKGPRLATMHLPEGRSQSAAQLEKLSDSFFRHLDGRGLTPAQLELTGCSVIGTVDDQASSIDYATMYIREFHVEGRLIGAFVLYSEQKVDYSRVFPLHLIEDEIRLLMKLRHLYSQAETLAVTDSLTGIFSQKHFMASLQHEFKSARRYEQDLSLALVAIDDLKHINEERGHSCGDEVLRHVAKITESCFRAVDIRGRFGGKYLALLLPSTAASPALLALERFQAKVAESPVSWQGTELSVTISIGLACVTPDMESVSTLLAQAEMALHSARRLGVNRIEIYAPSQ